MEEQGERIEKRCVDEENWEEISEADALRYLEAVWLHPKAVLAEMKRNARAMPQNPTAGMVRTPFAFYRVIVQDGCVGGEEATDGDDE